MAAMRETSTAALAARTARQTARHHPAASWVMAP
jgi:hypothetical protein